MKREDEPAIFLDEYGSVHGPLLSLVSESTTRTGGL